MFIRYVLPLMTLLTIHLDFSNGNWGCKTPPLENGFFSIEGGFLVAQCHDGFALIGSRKSKCIGRQWRPELAMQCQNYTCSTLSLTDVVSKTCLPPNDVKNGQIIPFKREYNEDDEIRVHCDNNYKVVGNYMLRCLGNNLWNVALPTCEASCEHLQNTELGEWNTEPDDENKAFFVCKPGWQLIRGLNGKNCVNGNKGFQWIGEDPVCKEMENDIGKLKTCPDPPVLKNGQIQPYKMGASYYAGEEVTVKCEPMFLPVQGSTSIFCSESGEWTDDFARCEPVTCETPEQPENGRIKELKNNPNNEEFEFGALINYECQPGYKLVGQHRRICVETGWSNDDPLCVLKNCGDLPLMEASRPIDFDKSKTWLPGEEMSIECLLGFTPVKPQQRLHLYCDENGEWMDKFAHCKAILCEPPPKIENGDYERLVEDDGNFSYGDEIFYHCFNNLVLVGQSKLQCTERGWSAAIPECKDIYCQKPELSPGVKIKDELPGYQYGSDIAYECAGSNYDLTGSSIQKCTENGWTGRTPFCKLTGCERPKIPDNGKIIHQYRSTRGQSYYGNFKFRESVVYGCNWGYRIELKEGQNERESSTSYCTDEGTWNQYPECIGSGSVSCWFSRTYCEKESYCTLPKQPDNGRYLTVLENDQYPINYVLTFKCNPGYTSSDARNSIRRCSSNGRWSLFQQNCVEVICDTPPDVPNANKQTEIYESRLRSGRRFLKKLTYGFKVVYYCREGYHLSKIEDNLEPSVTCTANGQWSNPNFRCESLMCPNPPYIRNGYLEVEPDTQFVSGSRAMVICQARFESSREDVYCRPDGQWDVDDFLCQPKKVVTCGPVPKLLNGAYRISGRNQLHPVGASAAVQCDRDYIPKSNYISCEKNGQWNYTGEECAIKTVTCGVPPIIPNGFVNVPSGMKRYPIGTPAQIVCENDYFSDSYIAKCDEKGLWDMRDVNCHQKKRFCGPPPNIKNGHVKEEDPERELFPIGYRIFYECQENYMLVGDDANACTDSDWFKDKAPDCVANQCDPLPEISNGLLVPPIKGKLIPNVDRVSVVCFPGYRSDYVRFPCDSDGKWDVEDVECIRDRSTDCIGPEKFVNGFIDNLIQEDKASYPFDHQLTYKCKEGFQLVGDDVRSCNYGGWTGEGPVCKQNFCWHPRKNERNAPKTRYQIGQVFKQQCPPGHAVLDGCDTIECMPGGKWNDTFSACEPFAKVACPLKELGNSRGVQLVPVNETTLELRCTNKTIPLNRHVIHGTCDERTGTWIIPQDMDCVPAKTTVGCDEQERIANGTIFGLKEGQIYREGDELSVTCDRGFRLADVGVDAITCLGSGYWTGAPASCEPITCEIDMIVENGEFEPLPKEAVVPYGKVLNIKCNPGYKIVGMSLLQCTESGWDSSIPSCKRVKCPDPGRPENAWYHVSSYDVGERVTFGCFSGYKLFGSKERVCMENGKWSGSLTICDSGSQDCPDPGTPVNGMKTGISYNHGDSVIFSCFSGYTLIGSRTRNCAKNAWDGQEAQCIGKQDFDDVEEVISRLRLVLKQAKAVEGAKPNDMLKPNAPRRQSEALRVPPAIVPPPRKNKLIICYIFDASPSIGEDNFLKSVNLAKALTQNVNISLEGTQSCAIVFTGEAEVIFNPSSYDNTADVVKALNAIKYEGRTGTSFQSAFKTLEDTVLNAAIESYPDHKVTFLTFLFTDGKVRPNYDLQKLVRRLKMQYNFKLYCLAITGFPNKDTLFSITSSYEHVRRVFLLDSYSSMDRITNNLLNNEKTDYSKCGIGLDKTLTERTPSDNETNVSDPANSQLWPWTVQIYIVRNSKSYSATCLGSLLNNRWILTSEFCFSEDTDPNTVLTKIGVRKPHVSFATEIQFLKTAPTKNVLSSNAALIKLKKTVTFSQFIRPICLPTGSRVFKPNSKGKIGYSSSWSKNIESSHPEDVSQIHLPIQIKEDCSGSVERPAVLGQNMFCAGNDAASLDVCGPDLGSPLFQYWSSSGNEIRWVQIGIASAFEIHYEGQDLCYNPSQFYHIFLDVSKWTTAIQKIINKN